MEDGEKTVEQQETMVEETVEQETEAVEAAKPKVVTQEEFDKVVKGLQKVISRKDSEIDNFKKSNQGDYSLTTLKKMATILERTLSSGDYADAESTRAAKAELKQINSDIALAQARNQESKVAAIRGNLHSKIKDSGFDINDSKFRTVRAYFKQGLFDEASEEADDIIAKLTENKETKVDKKEEPKFDVEKIKAEARAEAESEFLKKYNLTKQDGTKPGGGSKPFVDIEKKYANGEIDWATYQAARKENRIE